MTLLREFYALRAGVRVMPAPDGGVFLVSERGSQHSASPLVSAVLALTDGGRESQQIVSALPDYPAADVLFALSRLHRQGVLDRLSEARSPDQNRDVLSERVGRVRLVSTSPAAMSVMREALDAVPPAELEPVDLLLCSDYLEPLPLDFTNGQMPWLPVKLVGERSYFGPLFGPGYGACLACLQRRLRLNRPIETHLRQRAGGDIHPSTPVGRELAHYAAQTAAAVVERLLETPVNMPRLVEIGPQGQQIHEYACTCGSENRPDFDLRDQTPINRRLGGYRKRAVGEIVEHLRPLVSDLTGLISSAGPLNTRDPATDSAQDRHVWAASYPIVPRANLPGLDDFHGVALGKGLTDIQAQASAVCEAVERMSAQFPEGLDTLRASLGELGEEALHPNAIWQFSETQYRERAKWNALSRDERRHVPRQVAPDRELGWVPVWSVTQGRRKWMLRELCFANAPEPRFGRFDPNGCAAGSTHAEATIQALLELVERDSIAIWWYNRIPRPALDPMSVADARVRGLAQGLAGQGWDCWLLDLTADLAIPCLAAVARAKSDGRWCIGFGCHFDSEIAVERAMTELVQLFRADGRDGPPPWEPMAEADQRFLFPKGKATPSDAPTHGITTMGGLIGWTAEMLDNRGIEMLVLDQTRPDTMLPVVKVFAPGLRHFWPRFGPGRLYDVPVQMGWLDAPRAEGELNRTHLFL